jgi:superfamily II DNA or RNA helicase
MIKREDFKEFVELKKGKISTVDSEFKKAVLEQAYDKFQIVERRDYQEDSIFQALTYNMLGLKPLILAPTGSGKTLMGMITANMLSELTGNDISWCAPKKVLLAQALEDAEKFGVNINTQSLFQNVNTLKGAGISIEDEAHRQVCSTGLSFREKVQPMYLREENKSRYQSLGLSATPVRLDKASLFYDLFIKEVSTGELVKRGVLSSFNYYRAHLDWTPESLCEMYLKDASKWGKTIIFTKTIADSKKLTELLIKNGVKACEVHSKMSESDQDQSIVGLKSGEFDVLVNVDILKEGFDYPDLKTVFMKPSSKGLTIQMGGRVLRKSNNFSLKNIIQGMVSKSHIYKYSNEAEADSIFDIKKTSKGSIEITDSGMLKLSDGLFLATQIMQFD